jgi:hypothetical protein
MRGLLKLIDKTPDNATLLRSLNPAYGTDKTAAADDSTPPPKSSTRAGTKKSSDAEPTASKRRIPAAVSPRARRAKPKNQKG